jgi:hypothetical protein
MVMRNLPFISPPAPFTHSPPLFAVQVLNLVIGLSPRSGIDNLGHVGGFLTGAILGYVLAPDERPGRPIGRPRWGDALVRVRVPCPPLSGTLPCYLF